MTTQLNQKTSNYYTWTGDDLPAIFYDNVSFPDGGRIYGEVGKINIKNGDALSINFGANRQVLTRSGRGYESEYPNGRATLLGCAVAVILTAEQAKFLKIETSLTSELDIKIANQSKRIAPEIQDITEVFIFNEMKRRAEIKKSQELLAEQSKQKIQGALSQMENIFSKPPKP